MQVFLLTDNIMRVNSKKISSAPSTFNKIMSLHPAYPQYCSPLSYISCNFRFLLMFLVGLASIMPAEGLSERCHTTCRNMLFYDCQVCYQQCGERILFATCSKGSTRYKNYYPLSTNFPGVVGLQHGEELTGATTIQTPIEANRYYEEDCLQHCCGWGPTYFTLENVNSCESRNLMMFKIAMIIIICLMLLSLLAICSLSHRNNPSSRFCCFRCPRFRSNHTTNSEGAGNILATQENQYPISQWKAQKVLQWAILSNNSACAVCLQKKSDTATRCHHIFHFKCIQQWAHRNGRCPVCKDPDPNPYRIYCTKCAAMYVEVLLYKKNIHDQVPLIDEKIRLELMGGAYCPNCRKQGQVEYQKQQMGKKYSK